MVDGRDATVVRRATFGLWRATVGFVDVAVEPTVVQREKLAELERAQARGIRGSREWYRLATPHRMRTGQGRRAGGQLGARARRALGKLAVRVVCQG